jgi:hypothetical protein
LGSFRNFLRGARASKDGIDPIFVLEERRAEVRSTYGMANNGEGLSEMDAMGGCNLDRIGW